MENPNEMQEESKEAPVHSPEEAENARIEREKIMQDIHKKQTILEVQRMLRQRQREEMRAK